MNVPEAWKSAQERLRRRIWAARAAQEEGSEASPLSAPLQPPDLVAPTIVSPRPLIGPPIRVIKWTLHRLLVPLVFIPQAEFNLRVAAHLNKVGWVGNGHERMQQIEDDLVELRGEMLAVRAELQSQRVLLEKVGQADVTEATAPPAPAE